MDIIRWAVVRSEGQTFKNHILGLHEEVQKTAWVKRTIKYNSFFSVGVVRRFLLLAISQLKTSNKLLARIQKNKLRRNVWVQRQPIILDRVHPVITSCHLLPLREGDIFAFCSVSWNEQKENGLTSRFEFILLLTKFIFQKIYPKAMKSLSMPGLTLCLAQEHLLFVKK